MTVRVAGEGWRGYVVRVGMAGLCSYGVGGAVWFGVGAVV